MDASAFRLSLQVVTVAALLVGALVASGGVSTVFLDSGVILALLLPGPKLAKLFRSPLIVSLVAASMAAHSVLIHPIVLLLALLALLPTLVGAVVALVKWRMSPAFASWCLLLVLVVPATFLGREVLRLRIESAEASIGPTVEALEEFYHRYGRYPDSLEEAEEKGVDVPLPGVRVELGGFPYELTLPHHAEPCSRWVYDGGGEWWLDH